MMTVLLLCFCMGARADNIVTISSTEGTPGDEVTVSISLENTDALSSLQVSIPLDENLTLVEGSEQLGSRCPSHSLTMGVKDGELQVFIYSMSMTDISGNSGEVVSFRLKLGNQPTAVSLTPSKTVLTNGSGTTVAGSSNGGVVTTRCAKAQYSTMEVDFGEVPIHGTYTGTVTVTNVGNADLTVTDLVFSDINVFSSTTTLPFTVSAGGSKEVNITYAPVERGSITRTLKVECNSTSKLNTIKLQAQPFAVNELHVQDVSGTSDEEVTVRMTMNNMDAISGFQIEFTLPEQFEYVANSFALSSRKQDHQAIASLSGNKLTIMSYSNTDKPFTGDDGEIGSFRLKLAGRYGTTLTPTKTVLTATINDKVENVVSAVYDGQVDILSPQISSSSSLDFGAVSVTEDCEKTFTIYNYGSAPLTVSRIVFDNEHLSVKESLPLSIPVSGSSDVTVVYSSLIQTSFDARMQLYSNDPDLRLMNVTVTGSRYAPNFLTVSTPDVNNAGNLKIEIGADTYDDIAAVQFDVEYPSAYYEPFADNYTLTQRTEGMTVQQVEGDVLKVFCYFLNGGVIEAGEGNLMTLQLKPKASVPTGTYQVRVKNIKMSTTEMVDKYAGSDVVSSFRVKDAILGDVNGDGTVTPSDAIMILYHYFEVELNGFNEKAADINGDGFITPADAIAALYMYFNTGNSNARVKQVIDSMDPQ